MQSVPRFLLLAITTLMCSAAAAQAQKPPTPPTTAATPTVIPATPESMVGRPIPVVKDLVKGIVDEQRSLILTPEQYEAIRRTSSETRSAGATGPYPNAFVPRPVSRQIELDANPAAQPRLIRLAQGSITTFVFSDQNGNPWLVTDVSFDPRLFSDGRTGQASGAASQPPATNVIKLQPLTQYAYGNVVVQLEGFPSALTFMLATGYADEVDVQVAARISGKNPNAKAMPMALDTMPERDEFLATFLDGVAPKDARRLLVSGGAAEVWALGEKMYVRTRLAALSPAFIDHAGSADGMHVYAYAANYSSLLMSNDGKHAMLSVTGF